MQKDPGYEKEVRMEPGAFAPKKDLKGKAKETEAFEGWVDSVGEASIKPYVSMYKGDDGKMIYDVLDKDSQSAFKSGDYKAAEKYLHQNYDKLKEAPKPDHDDKKDKENPVELNVTKADKEGGTVAYKRMKAGAPGYVDKTDEGNEFAHAVRKAKAAGMKAGDKFKVGDKEYTLQDAIELAGMQLEDFFSEEEQAYDSQIDRIKALSFYQ